METSLRYGEDSKALRIHAKEKFPIDSNTYFQVHGELDTKLAQPTSSTALIRHFYPNLSATLGVGFRYDKRDKLRYTVRAKKTFPVTLDGSFNFKIKGGCDVDKDFKERKSRGAAEFSWNKLNFQKDQDVRFRIGYEIFEQRVLEGLKCGDRKPNKNEKNKIFKLRTCHGGDFVVVIDTEGKCGRNCNHGSLLPD